MTPSVSELTSPTGRSLSSLAQRSIDETETTDPLERRFFAEEMAVMYMGLACRYYRSDIVGKSLEFMERARTLLADTNGLYWSRPVYRAIARDYNLLARDFQKVGLAAAVLEK